MHCHYHPKAEPRRDSLEWRAGGALFTTGTAIAYKLVFRFFASGD